MFSENKILSKMNKKAMLNALQQHFSHNQPKDFAELLGISAQVLSNWKNRNTFDVGIVYTKCLGINPHWLLTGEGKMLNEEEKNSSAQPSEEGIPLISLEAAAGFGNGAFSVSNEDIMGRYVVPDFVGIDFMLRVKGSSMYPKYSSGDVIACRVIREISFIQWNKVYVIITREQGMLCKRIKKAENANQLLIVSDNKDYDPFEIDRSEITGIALVIGTIRLE